MAIYTKEQMDLDIKLQKKSYKQIVELIETIEKINDKCGNGSAIEAAGRCLMKMNILREKILKESKENGTYRIWFDNPD